MYALRPRSWSVAALVFLAFAGPAAAQTPPSAFLSSLEVWRPVSNADTVGPLSAPAAQQQGVRLPRSAQDHLELATLYRTLGAQNRGEAEAMRQVLVAELRQVAQFPNKSGTEFPWVARLRRNAQPAIDQAERAAADADRLAEYHALRAKETEGREFETLAAALSRRRP